MRGTALELLEAQAATGKIIDPISGERLTVDDAFIRGLFDRRYQDTLKRAEKAIIGYKLHDGKILSLFQAIKRGLVAWTRGVRLLEAQIATGGLIDPRASHRVPIKISFERGLFDRQLYETLEDSSDDTKGFFDPNTNENLTYLQLIKRCPTDDNSVRFLKIKDKDRYNLNNNNNSMTFDNYSFSNSSNKTERFSTLKTTEHQSLYSREHITATKSTNVTKKTRHQIMLPSLFGQGVNVWDLVDNRVIDESLANLVASNKIRPVDLAAQIQQHLRGTDVVGAVYIKQTKEIITFYQAYARDYISRESCLQLLQAQCCTGGIIDPYKSQRYRVGEAYMEGMIPREFIQPLERAEKAVFGFIKKESGRTLHVLEALKSHLCSAEEAKIFLQAQLASGGVILAKKFYRIDEDRAVQLGYLDTNMVNLSTTCFTNPITNSPTTYSNILKNCTSLPNTYAKLVEISDNLLDPIDERNAERPENIKLSTALNKEVSLSECIDSKIIPHQTAKAIASGSIDTFSAENMFKTFLFGDPPISGILCNNQSLNFPQAYDQGLINQATCSDLLEAQVASIGKIMDPQTGKIFNLKEAKGNGLVDARDFDVANRARKAIEGFNDPLNPGRICQRG